MSEPLTLETLEGFEQLLAVQEPSLPEHLLPGLREAEIDRRLRPLGLDVEAIGRDAVTWWRWHDGIGPHRWLESPIRHLTFLPLHEAVDRTAFFRSELRDEGYPAPDDPHAKRTRDTAIQHATEEIAWTYRTMVVMAATNGDVVVIDTGHDDRPVHYNGVTDSMGPKPIANDLGELVRSWIARLEHGIPAGELDADPFRAADDPRRLFPCDAA